MTRAVEKKNQDLVQKIKTLRSGGASIKCISEITGFSVNAIRRIIYKYDIHGMSVFDRFMSYVSPCPTSGCWLWTGAAGNRYGRFRVGGRDVPMVSAHRYAYEQFKCEIPDGLVVMHACDVMLCVNPDHLSVGTYKDNSKDMANKGRNEGFFVSGYDGRRSYERRRQLLQEREKEAADAKEADATLPRAWR